MRRAAGWLVVPLSLLLIPPSIAADQKKLRPQPTEGQKVFEEKETKIPIVAQQIDGAYVQASVIKSGELFKVGVLVGNPSEQTIQLVQEKVFLLNAYGRQLYRLSDYEVREGWVRLLNLPPPPPPPPRRYYTIEGSGTADYRLNDLGEGYSTVTGGFSSTYRVEEHYDYSATLGFVIGSRIRTALDRRKARKQIEMLDRYYFSNMDIPPHKQTERMLFFTAGAVSGRVPVTLVLVIGERQFKFVFSE